MGILGVQTIAHMLHAGVGSSGRCVVNIGTGMWVSTRNMCGLDILDI